VIDRPLRRVAAGLVLLLAGSAWAESVALQGMLGNRALLIVNGGAPKAVAPGDTHQGVKVISTQGDQAVLESGGKRYTLRVGEAPSSVGAGDAGGPSGRKIVLNAGTGGHFMSDGAINGKPAYFMVDTGASVVSLGSGDAERLGIDYKSGQPVRLSTANGTSMGWRILLASVRIGDVEVSNVDAVVGQAPMPYILLGNSFLTRFQMRRDNDQMVLERRF
jgi:aspartyl protease family protein